MRRSCTTPVTSGDGIVLSEAGEGSVAWGICAKSRQWAKAEHKAVVSGGTAIGFS